MLEVQDLCQRAAAADPALRELAENSSLTVLACFPRVVRWLFHASGNPLAPDRVSFLNMRQQSAEEILAALLGDATRGERSDGVLVPDTSGEWVPWFPVIDYDRCKNCKQCLSFCLFGVYALADDGCVSVANPRQCKNNCPACARICPEVAIIFPKLDEAPLNGDEVTAQTVADAKVRVSVDQLFGGDAYAALVARGRRRKSRLLKRDALDTALAERQACSRHSEGATAAEPAPDPDIPSAETPDTEAENC